MVPIVADVEEKPMQMFAHKHVLIQIPIPACLFSSQCICEQNELTFLYVVEQPRTGQCREMSVSVL